MLEEQLRAEASDLLERRGDRGRDGADEDSVHGPLQKQKKKKKGMERIQKMDTMRRGYR